MVYMWEVVISSEFNRRGRLKLPLDLITALNNLDKNETLKIKEDSLLKLIGSKGKHIYMGSFQRVLDEENTLTFNLKIRETITNGTRYIGIERE